MNTSSSKNLLFGIAGALWLLTAFIGYAYAHKPFSPEGLTVLLIALCRIGIVALLVSLSGALGYRILNGNSNQPVSQTVLQASLGLGIIGVLTLLLGATVGFHLWLFASILTLSGLLLRRNMLGWWRAWMVIKGAWAQIGAFGKLTAALAFVILSCSFFVALAPPLQFDALTYHLAIPHSYLQAGRITYLQDNMFWGMPELTEILYALAMLFGGIETATLLGWAMGCLTLAGLYAYIHERIGANAAWASLTCLLAGTTFASSLAWGYVEWPVMLFGVCMLVAFNEWEGGQNKKGVVLAGVFAGMALATKYSAGILLIAGTAVILWELPRLRFSSTVKTLFLFGITAVLVMSPWMVKNYLATGNPFYPLLFPAGAMDRIRVEFYQKDTASLPWYEMLILPWQATVWGVEGRMGYSASIGPLLLGLAPLAWIGWRARSGSGKEAIKLAGIVSLMGWIIWGVGSLSAGLLVQSRLYFAMFPAWAALGGAGFDSIGKLNVPGIRFGRIAAALIVLAMGFSTYESVIETQRYGPVNVILGLRPPEKYLVDNLGSYAAAMDAIDELPSGSRVLMLWETRSLYCLPTCDPDEVIDLWFHDIRVYGDADGVLAAWRSQGYTHLLYRGEGAAFAREYEPFFTERDWAELDALLAKLGTPETFGKSYSLYSLSHP